MIGSVEGFSYRRKVTFVVPVESKPPSIKDEGETEGRRVQGGVIEYEIWSGFGACVVFIGAKPLGSAKGTNGWKGGVFDLADRQDVS